MLSGFYVLIRSLSKSGGLPESIGASIAGWFGGFLYGPSCLSYSLVSLAMLVILDWLSGVRASRYEGKAIESSRLRRTGDKAIGYSIGLAAIALFTKEVGISRGVMSGVMSGLCWYFMVVELWSIIENLDRMKVPLPGWIVRRVRQIEKQLDEGKFKGWGPLS